MKHDGSSSSEFPLNEAWGYLHLYFLCPLWCTKKKRWGLKPQSEGLKAVESLGGLWGSVGKGGCVYATSRTPAATSCLESQSSPSWRPVPLRASQPWMCQLLPQHSLWRLSSSVISSTDTAPGTSCGATTGSGAVLHTKRVMWCSCSTCLLAKMSSRASLSSFSVSSLANSLWASMRRSLWQLSITNTTAARGGRTTRLNLPVTETDLSYHTAQQK